MASPHLHVTFNPDHFAEGRFRRAYKAIYKGPPSKYGQQAVVKENKESYMWEERAWDTCVSMNQEAQSLAAGFNTFSGTNYPVSFTDITVAKVTERSDPNRTPKLGEYCVVEDYIPGEFKKWCNNYGFISKEARESHHSMPAFMHWSWINSRGEKMISDLQGARNDDSYILTDPAMLSADGKYGVTDTGVEGMAMFFLHHECNLFCNSLRKPQFSDFKSIIPSWELANIQATLANIGSATSYSHELKLSAGVKQGISHIFRRVATGY